jgi:hypothetical protein
MPLLSYACACLCFHHVLQACTAVEQQLRDTSMQAHRTTNSQRAVQDKKRLIDEAGTPLHKQL